MDAGALANTVAEQAVAVWNAPIPFLAAIIFVGWLIWLGMRAHYRGRLESKDGLIALKDGQLQDYKDKLSGATPDEARARLDALESRIDALGPRKITAEQRRRMIPELELFRGCKVDITADATSADAAQLARGLTAAFNAAGWRVQNGVGLGIGSTITPASGIGLLVENPSALTDAQTAIISALNGAGLEHDVLRKGGPTLDRDGAPMESMVLSNKLDD